MSFTVIIPARLKSSRLPDKPLADICGRPMIVRVAERALSCGADRVVVAVDDASVYEACAAAGLDVIMTDPHHPTGTDRLAEAVAKIGLADDEIVVNLQGDEPLMPLDVIRDVADLLASRPDCAMATAAHTIHDVESFFNPNVVKVVHRPHLLPRSDPLAQRPLPRNEGKPPRRLRAASPSRSLCLPCRLPAPLSHPASGSFGKARESGAASRPLLRRAHCGHGA